MQSSRMTNLHDSSIEFAGVTRDVNGHMGLCCNISSLREAFHGKIAEFSRNLFVCLLLTEF